MFKLILFDRSIELCNEFSNAFKELPNVEVKHSYLENLEEYDCIVSPANSFGLMDGGIDLVITNYFGVQLMERVQKYIIDNYAGEQPVGTSFVINTNNSLHPYLVHTPTMRVPMDIRNTDNVYQAMKSMLIEVSKYPDIKSIACSGLGTATGMVSYKVASQQMALAYQNILNPPKEINWKFATLRNKEIYKIL